MFKIFEYIRKLIYRDGVTPLPFALTTAVYVIMIFYGMSVAVVFAFLPKMVKSFGISELNAGYYVGITASSLYIGRAITSMLWGYLIDAKGKRFCMILSECLLILLTLAFGFSHNLYWAMLTRFLQGCSMGQAIIAKVMIADISDDTNMSLGLSIVTSAYSVGIILGPSLGGFVVFPAELYPHVFSKGNVFGKFGVLLPNFIIAIGLGFGAVLAIIYLPNDSHGKESPSYGSVASNTRKIEEKDLDGHVQFNCYETNTISLFQRFMTSRFIRILKVKDFRSSCVLYGLFSMVDVGFLEIFPVLTATDPAYRGMGFTTSQIGTVLIVVSLITVILQLTVMPKVTNYFGAKKSIIASNLTVAFLCPMLPVIAAVKNMIALWGCLILNIALVRICVSIAYLSINILVNNSVEPGLRGSANGLAMAVASVGRLIGPLITGSLYTWSLTNIKGIETNKDPVGFPFDQFLAFYVLSMFSIFIAVLTSALPERMTRKKKSSANNRTLLLNGKNEEQ